MSVPTCIFAPNRRQALALAECLGCPALVTGADMNKIISDFRTGESLLIVADICSMAVGWHGPDHMAIAFLEGCDDVGYAFRVQAEGRLHRANGRLIAEGRP